MTSNSKKLKSNIRKAKETLAFCLKQAIKQCKEGNEEQGGFILQKGSRYKFIKIHNDNSGTSIAKALYTANRKEFGDKVISLIVQGWDNIATFHTHPNGFSASPSNIDLDKIFKNCRTNYIYSTQQNQLVQYVWGQYYRLYEMDDNKGVALRDSNEAWLSHSVKLTK